MLVQRMHLIRNRRHQPSWTNFEAEILDNGERSDASMEPSGRHISYAAIFVVLSYDYYKY